MMARVFNTFLDGEWLGNSSLSAPIDANDGKLGVGGTADGSSLFKGWIDDFRIYSVALQHRDVKKSYGGGCWVTLWTCAHFFLPIVRLQSCP